MFQNCENGLLFSHHSAPNAIRWPKSSRRDSKVRIKLISTEYFNTWLHSLAISNIPFQLELQITVQINQRTRIKSGCEKIEKFEHFPIFFIFYHFSSLFFFLTKQRGEKRSCAETKETLLNLALCVCPRRAAWGMQFKLWFFILFSCLTLKSRPTNAIQMWKIN